MPNVGLFLKTVCYAKMGFNLARLEMQIACLSLFVECPFTLTTYSSKLICAAVVGTSIKRNFSFTETRIFDGFRHFVMSQCFNGGIRM